jgi:hypothetical protein
MPRAKETGMNAIQTGTAAFTPWRKAEAGVIALRIVISSVPLSPPLTAEPGDG